MAPSVTPNPAAPEADALLKYILAYDDVRIVAGLATKELPDNQLQSGVFVYAVEAYLTGIYEGTIDVMEVLEKKVEDYEKDPNSNPKPTRKERALLGLIKVVSTYVCASQINVSMIGLKRITDGKSEQERFANSFAEVLAGIATQLAQYRELLRQALIDYGEPVPDQKVFYGVGSVGLGTDPVTGE